MWQWFLRGLAALAVAGACLLPAPARAQTQAANPNAPSLGQSGDTTEKGHPPPVAAYAVAVLFTIIVLLLICVPSRKG
jgi:hypothetical protein